MLLGVDVGGTFTDAVLVASGRVITAKAPTTPADQSLGVLDAVRAVLARASREAGEVDAFAHGMTVATNALLEGAGARTALVATEGFTDVVELGRQARKDLYRLCARHPPPLVPPDRRVAAPERTGPAGVLRALTDEAAAQVARDVAATEPESVAVCLLHADRFPAHERAIGAALAEALPGVHVSLSHEVVGTFREFERAATTEVDAALSPLLAAYLRRLLESCAAEGLPAPAIMQSSGGLAEIELAAGHAALTVLSGPAGGAAAAALIAERTGTPDLLCFDMGGTSCDVCVVEGGRVRETTSHPPREVGGRPIALPMVDIHTVGAGGGSIAWIDPGGALRVGPRSAGADPGPACYGRGGTEPTVTDANLVLGLLDGELSGVPLDRDAAERALATLGIEDAAQGVVRVANAEMIRALRVMTVERGLDPRDFALLAFGGAGGLHAAQIAEELGIRRILCPRASGVLSALGLAAAERRVDVQRTVLGQDADLDALAAEARERLGDAEADVDVRYDCRYRGQSFELTVDDPARFADAHEERYGFRQDDGDVEVVTLRVTARSRAPRIELAGGEVAAPGRETRPTVLGDETAVLRGDLPAGTRIAGPAVCLLPEATLAVPAGWAGRVDDEGTVVLDRRR